MYKIDKYLLLLPFSLIYLVSLLFISSLSNSHGLKFLLIVLICIIQFLVANLTEGSQRLSHATKAGETTLPSTSASGQTKIRQQLQAINKDFEDFRVQLVQVALTIVVSPFSVFFLFIWLGCLVYCFFYCLNSLWIH